MFLFVDVLGLDSPAAALQSSGTATSGNMPVDRTHISCLVGACIMLRLASDPCHMTWCEQTKVSTSGLEPRQEKHQHQQT
jgi:hypothetical protein